MGKSIYKGVRSIVSNGRGVYYMYQIEHKNTRYCGTYKTEREAALQYDLKRIDLGLEPINILKAKT